MEKRQRGRPRKQEDTIQPWQFGRAAHALCIYDEARGRGDKHSVAVAYTVDAMKKCNPAMSISQSEVRRILASWRPRGSHAVLRFERLSLSEENIQRRRWIREQLATLREKKGVTLPTPPDHDLARNTVAFTIRFAERPNYPRYNRKTSSE
jgi:hypothetical protein